MNTMNQFEITTLLGEEIWLVVRYMFLLGLGLYLVFALVIVRQVGLMTKTLAVGFEFPIKVLAYLHLIAAVFLFFFAFISL